MDRYLAPRNDFTADPKVFPALLPQLTGRVAMKIDLFEQSEDTINFNVTRSHYSKLYRKTCPAAVLKPRLLAPHRF